MTVIRRSDWSLYVAELGELITCQLAAAPEAEKKNAGPEGPASRGGSGRFIRWSHGASGLTAGFETVACLDQG